MEGKKPLQKPSKPQRWGNYLKEFLMLFLAVFFGFLAENYREELSKRQDTNTYLKSLLEDLNRDSLEVMAIKRNHDFKMSKLESLKKEIISITPSTDSRLAYELLNTEIGFVDFIASDGTYEQLKNDGGLKSIEEKEIIDHLMLYDKRIKTLAQGERIANDYLKEMANLNRYFDLVLLTNKDFKASIPLLDGSREAKNDLYYHLKNWIYLVTQLENQRQIIVEEASALKKAIIKHYPNL